MENYTNRTVRAPKHAFDLKSLNGDFLQTDSTKTRLQPTTSKYIYEEKELDVGALEQADWTELQHAVPPIPKLVFKAPNTFPTTTLR